MATLAAARQDMEGFVQGLFQGSPDLSILTHAIVRKKYLAHVGKETLTKEEKDQLKRLIEKELLQVQIEDSGDEELLIKLKPSAEPGGQKRAFCPSDSSEDEVESKHERKKRRTGKELKLSSDEEDSGIDSKKARASRGPEHAGKSSSSSNHGDSGAEGHAGASGSEEESGKDDTAAPSRRTNREALGSPSSKWPRGRGRGERAGSEGEESGGGPGSDVEEEAGRPRKATKLRTEESENKSECKLQKKKGMDRDEKRSGRVEKGECIREGKQRGKKRGTESEDESDLSETRGRKRTDWRESGKERAGGDGHQAKMMGGPRGRKAQEQSLSEDESDCAPREKQKTQRKAAAYKHQKKGWSAEKSESDSDDIKSKGPRRKSVCKTKSRRASAEELKTDSDSEEREVLAKKVKNQGAKKAQGKGESRKAPGGNQAHRNPVKQRGGPKPKRSMSQKESGSEADEEMDSAQKKKGPWDSSSSENESLSEAEQREKVKKPSEKSPVRIDDSGSSSEETAGVSQRQKRLSEERKVKKEVFGSDSSEEEEELIKKGAEKPQQERVSKAESMTNSEDSGSESSAKAKNRSQQEKQPQKPKGRSHSQEETRSDSGKEEQPSSSGDEDGPRSSGKQHQGKDKEHRSAKGEDHPAVQRLKRYIRECGARRNYKKLLMGCHSRKAQLEVLKQELENLGLKGTPSLAKCKALKKKLEEAAEVASLDLSNIITTEGRPRRRNVWSLYGKPEEPPQSPEEPPIHRRATDWSRLRGVISSDDESD